MPRLPEANMAAKMKLRYYGFCRYKTRLIFAWSYHELKELFFQFLHENTRFRVAQFTINEQLIKKIDVTLFVRIAMCFFKIPPRTSWKRKVAWCFWRRFSELVFKRGFNLRNIGFKIIIPVYSRVHCSWASFSVSKPAQKWWSVTQEFFAVFFYF